MPKALQISPPIQTSQTLQNMDSSSSQAQPLHVLFFPMMAPGHMLPILDMANLFAARGVTASVLTTPANAHLVRPPVNLHLISFPSGFGLPDGCENLSKLPNEDLGANFSSAVAALRLPFDLVLRDLRPDCLVSDEFLPWTHHAAAELDIPRLVFHVGSVFSLCLFDSADRFWIYESLSTPDVDSFVFPGLPHEIKMLKSQMPKLEPYFLELFSQMKETEPKSYGEVVNSFYDLEPDYVRHYREVAGRRTWLLGPMLLCNDRASRLADDCESEGYLNWLHAQRPGSIVYVSFGSLSVFTTEQLDQIAEGLVACDCHFVWVVGKCVGGWSSEEFKKRTVGRGLVVKGWAPQRVMLSHKAVGAFMTHCGWNSLLEGLCAGLPLITWPLFAEQFCNERLIVDVLNVGVAVGSKEFALRPEARPVVGAFEIERAVRQVMGGGEEADRRRGRATELGVKARAAVERGGSSHQDLSGLIQELTERRRLLLM